MKLVLSENEIKEACIEYLRKRGVNVTQTEMKVSTHTDGDYDDAVFVFDGIEVELKPEVSRET